MCNGGACGCGNGQGGSCSHKMGYWGYKLIWAVVALVVLGIVFCSGFKLGLVSSHFMGGGYGHNMMYRTGGKVLMMEGRGPGMMGNWQMVETREMTTTPQ